MNFDGLWPRGFWGEAGRKGMGIAGIALACLVIGSEEQRIKGPQVSPLILCSSDPVILEWKEIHDKLGGFKVSFPTEPKYTEKQMDTGAGRLTVHAYNLEEGPISWVVSWWEFTPEYVRNTGSVSLLNGAKEAFFKRFKGKFLSEKIVQLGAAPGRDTLFETEDEVRIRLKAYLRGNKLIQVLAIAEPDLIDGADAKKFFDSLKWE